MTARRSSRRAAVLTLLAAVVSSGCGPNPAPRPSPFGDIQVNDSIAPSDDRTLAFGPVPTGTSAEGTVTVTNTGLQDLLLYVYWTSDSFAADPSKTWVVNPLSGEQYSPLKTTGATYRVLPVTGP